MENYGDYLEKKAETGEDAAEWPNALEQPLIRDAQYEDSKSRMFRGQSVWTIEGGNEDLQLRLSYGASNTDEVLDLLTEFEERKSHHTEFLRQTVSQWRMLEGFTLTDKVGNTLDLTPLLKRKKTDNEASFTHTKPERQLSVMFLASNEIPPEWKELGLASPDKTAILVADSTTPRGIIMLLHELGHLEPDLEGGSDRSEHNKTRARYQTYMRTLNRNLLTKEELSMPDIHERIAGFLLEEERNAWARALGRLRPFVRSGALDREEVLTAAHSIALTSYSKLLENFAHPSVMEGLYRKLVSQVNTLLSTLLGGRERV